MEGLLLGMVLLSGFYMAWNIGANDVANAMGTSVGSGALSLRQAVMVAAVLEFCGAFFFGSRVTETIESGIISAVTFEHNPTILVLGMLSALLSAGIWLQIASYFGWPVSTTHSIIGAVVGFGAVVGGVHAIQWNNVLFIAGGWLISPFLGGIIAYIIFNYLMKRIFYKTQPLKAACQQTPFLVFGVVTVVGLAVFYETLGAQGHPLVVGLCPLVGVVAGGGSYLWVRKIEREKSHFNTLPYNPLMLRKLEKARRHLQYVQTYSHGEMSSQATSLMDQIQNMEREVEAAVDTEESRSEFSTVEKIFGKLQLMSACLMAFSHGANDVANAMGPLSAAVSILMTGSLSHTIPLWVLALGGIGIVFGLATWGWRVIETIGRKLTELTPTRGFAAEFGAAVTILFASRMGIPISATHTLVGSVLGVGFARGIEALNMNTMRDIIVSWIITIPIGALLSVSIYTVLSFFF